MSSEPWTRAEQINYSTFGTKEAPREWGAAIAAISALAQATGYKYDSSNPRHDIFSHFMKVRDRYEAASMSVD